MARDIVIVGSGNVATHIAGALSDRVHTIISRNPDNARELAGKIGVGASSDYGIISEIKPEIIIISIADNAVNNVVAEIGRLEYNPLVVHTSGTIHKEILSAISPRTGVLYPLQTFSKTVDVDMSAVPIFIEAAVDTDADVLFETARSMSSMVFYADAAKRSRLHIAGVFSSNFIIAMLEVAARVLTDAGYPLETVKPLVNATVAKAFEIGPYNAMTGPAVRGDRQVMNRQSQGLEGVDRHIYDLLSDYIVQSHNVNLK